MRQTLIILLVIVAIIMIYLGLHDGTKLPPVFSGIGFIVIAAIFLNEGKKA